MNTEIGKWLLFAGGLIMLAGLLFILFGDKLGWLGRLPGDIRIERDNFRFYFPLTTMLLVSLFLTLVVSLISRFLRG